MDMEDSVDVLSGANQAGPCRLPAGVPQLPSGLRVSPEMQQLSEKLLSATTGPRVGFHGMGMSSRCLCSAAATRPCYAHCISSRHSAWVRVHERTTRHVVLSLTLKLLKLCFNCAGRQAVSGRRSRQRGLCG